MIRRSWRTQLKAATTQQAVLTVVSDFLDEWSPREIAALPPEARPPRPASRSDVVAHALKLGRIHADMDAGEGLPGVQEMLLFFTHAAVRITQLAAGAPVDIRVAGPLAQMKPVADEES